LSKLRSHFDRIWLVDPRPEVGASVAATIDGRYARALAEVEDELQLAIIATPNVLHAPVAHEALGLGAHLLIEKPFVISPADGRRLIAAAAKANRIIAINQTRRLYPMVRELRRRILGGDWGLLLAGSHFEGTKLAWPFESGAAFLPGAERTGTLMDFGVHVMDLYHYLLSPSWELTSAIHDGFEGPEGLAQIEVRASGAPISIRLSRYYTQRNTAHLQFERAEVGFDVYDANNYWVKLSAQGATKRIKSGTPDDPTHAEVLILNFIAASAGRETPICDAVSSQPVIEILDQAYTHASRYPAAIGRV
jgi:predicted dehydrogenase